MEDKVQKRLTKITMETSPRPFAKLGKEIVDFGEAIDNEKLTDWGERMSHTAEFAGDLAKKVSVLAEEMKGNS